MKALMTGAGGQLGTALRTLAPLEAVRQWRPEVISVAAYTYVDEAEMEQLAFEVHAEAPRGLAKAAAAVNARLIHASTDFVFAGDRRIPYDVHAETQPRSVYGRSKLAGEHTVLPALGFRPPHWRENLRVMLDEVADA